MELLGKQLPCVAKLRKDIQIWESKIYSGSVSHGWGSPRSYVWGFKRRGQDRALKKTLKRRPEKKGRVKTMN